MENKSINSTVKIVLLSVLLIIIMSIIDGIIKPGYVYKSLVKIFVFLFIPITYAFIDSQVSLKDKLKINGIKEVLFALGLGLGIYVFIMMAYLILRNFLDLNSIMETLSKDVGVAKSNFLWVALYISFVNSFIEEFFFRGFLFLNLKKISNLTFAYTFSALAFALYHIAIMGTWFSIELFILALLGLFMGGLIFNYLDTKSNNIYSSWIVHMMANFAINTVGFIMFGLLNL